MVRGAGEKVLNRSITFAGTTLFTSFTPIPGNACTPSDGLNRLYIVNTLNGQAVTNLDGEVDDAGFDTDDRVLELEQGGIAPEVQLIFTEGPQDDGPDDGSPQELVACVGIECPELPEDTLEGPTYSRTFWYQEEEPPPTP